MIRKNIDLISYLSHMTAQWRPLKTTWPLTHQPIVRVWQGLYRNYRCLKPYLQRETRPHSERDSPNRCNPLCLTSFYQPMIAWLSLESKHNNVTPLQFTLSFVAVREQLTPWILSNPNSWESHDPCKSGRKGQLHSCVDNCAGKLPIIQSFLFSLWTFPPIHLCTSWRLVWIWGL